MTSEGSKGILNSVPAYWLSVVLLFTLSAISVAQALAVSQYWYFAAAVGFGIAALFGCFTGSAHFQKAEARSNGLWLLTLVVIVVAYGSILRSSLGG